MVDPVGNPTVYTKLPSAKVSNGSLINIEARDIMSAIAGNVDRIASITVAKNIRVLNGIIGSDKPAPLGAPVPGALGTKDYLDQNGVYIANGRPVRDGRLVDGAFIAQIILDAAGRPTTLPTTRVFNL